MNYTVYKHVCPNSKVYIGITSVNPKYRWNSGRGYSTNNHFFRAIKKYGWNNIKHEILFEGLSKEEAEQKEIELIKLYNSNNSQYGYNKSTGGDRSSKGCKRSEETKIKLSISNRGKKRTGQQRQNIKTKCRENSGKTVVSVEENIKRLNGTWVKYTRIRKYNSISEASEQTGTHKNTIYCGCKKKIKNSKIIWRYYDDYIHEQKIKRQKEDEYFEWNKKHEKELIEKYGHLSYL